MKSRNQQSLEKQLFITSVKVCLAAALILLVLDTLYFKDYLSAITESLGVITCSVFLFLSRKSKNTGKLIFPFIVFLLILMNVGWYFGGGLNTGNVLILLLIFYISLVMVKKKYRKPLIIFFFIDLAVMMVWEFVDFGIREELTDLREELIASDILILITFSAGIYFITYVKGRYEELKNLLEEKNHQLLEFNHELTSINENLENTVQQRTRHIQEQNRKILEYAFMNSHKVRGPLARILGLTALFEMNYLETEEVTDSLMEIKKNATELDHQIKEINLILDSEEMINE